MDGHSKLLDRLLDFDKTTFEDLKVIGEGDPIRACEILWSFITQVAEVSPHVPSGLVDRALLMMFDLLGPSITESRIAASWDSLGEETR